MREVGVLRHLADVLVLREHRHPALDEGPVARGRHLELVLDGVVHVGHRGRRKALVLVALGHVDGGRHRQLQARGRLLRVEVLLVLADQERHHPVGLGLLDAGDDLAELRDRERDELFRDDLAAEQRHEGAGPGGGELAEIVVGGDRVAARAELLDHVLHGRDDLLLADRPGAERVGVGHAAFVLVGVEVELLELVDDRPDRLALGAGEARHQHVDLVLLDQAAGELLPQRVVALAVDRDELDLAAEDALLAGIDQHVGLLVEDEVGLVLGPAVVDDVEARALLADHRRVGGDLALDAELAGADAGGPLQRLALVDLLHRELGGVELLDAVDREVAQLVLDEADLDRSPGLRLGRLQEAEAAQVGRRRDAGGGGSLDHRPAVGTGARALRRSARGVARRLAHRLPSPLAETLPVSRSAAAGRSPAAPRAARRAPRRSPAAACSRSAGGGTPPRRRCRAPR